jgi:hypothetical protein
MSVEVNVSVEGRNWRNESPEVQAGLTGLRIVVRSVLEANERNGRTSWFVTEGTHPDDLPAFSELVGDLHRDVNDLRADIDPVTVEWHGETLAALGTDQFQSFMDDINPFGPAYSFTPNRENPTSYDLVVHESEY